MPITRFTPSDLTALTNREDVDGIGITTDVALGTPNFTAIKIPRYARIGASYTLQVQNSGGAGTARLQYTIDGGGGPWVDLVTRSADGLDSIQNILLGNLTIASLDDVQLRCQSQITSVGGGAQFYFAELLGWEVAYVPGNVAAMEV